MIIGEIKNKVDVMWDGLAAGGLTNPLEVIEQVTYLMFIHDLDEKDISKAKSSRMIDVEYESIFPKKFKLENNEIDGDMLRWSVFRDYEAERMYTIVSNYVFPFIKNLHANKDSAFAKYMEDAMFKLPTPNVLSKTVDSLDDIYNIMNTMESTDARGDVYEYLLGKLSTAGRNGQFRTPRQIIRMMVELMDPQPEDIIADPACGTAGFLFTAAEYLKETYKKEIFYNKENKDHFMNEMFTGYEMDRTMLRIAAMNMMTHDIDSPTIEYRDSLSDQNPDTDRYSLILANPPFTGSLDSDIVSKDLLKVCKTKKTELLFVTLFIRMLKIGGRCACIVPDGVLFGSSKAHKSLRKELIENNRLEAIISMPSGVFKPYAGVSTGIMIFTKTGHGGTDNVWFYDMQSDGFSLDDKRTPIKDNDIPDIINRFKHLENEKTRERTDKSFFVSKEEIVNNDYDLSINKYKKTVYVPVEYEPTTVILDKIDELEIEIQKDLKELRNLLK